jgi:hypothetical protein
MTPAVVNNGNKIKFLNRKLIIKGTLAKDFRFPVFILGSSSPSQAPGYSISAIQICWKIRTDIENSRW